ncbi:MAG: hypothetical protein ACFCVD_23955 [Nodosilinea sp.]
MIVLQTVFPRDRPCPPQSIYLFLADLGIGGEQYDLVASLGKVEIDQVVAVF